MHGCDTWVTCMFNTNYGTSHAINSYVHAIYVRSSGTHTYTDDVRTYKSYKNEACYDRTTYILYKALGTSHNKWPCMSLKWSSASGWMHYKIKHYPLCPCILEGAHGKWLTWVRAPAARPRLSVRITVRTVCRRRATAVLTPKISP